MNPEELFEKYAKNELGPNEEKGLIELLEDEENRKNLAEFMQEWYLLAEVSKKHLQAEAESVRQKVHTAKKPMFNSAWKWAAAAACFLMIAGVVFFYAQPQFTMIGHFNAQTGDVSVSRDSRKIQVVAEMEIRLNDSVRTGDGTARISYSGDNSGIILAEQTSITFMEENGSRKIEVESGIIDCSIDKQPVGAPFVLISPHTLVTVKGTRFRMNVKETHSSIELTEGLVNVTRLSDGKSLELTAGEYTVIDPLKPLIAADMYPILLTDGFESTEGWNKPGNPVIGSLSLALVPHPVSEGMHAMKVSYIPSPERVQGGSWKSLQLSGKERYLELKLYPETYRQGGEICFQLCLDNNWNNVYGYYRIPSEILESGSGAWHTVRLDLKKDSLHNVDLSLLNHVTAIGVYLKNTPITVYLDDLRFLGHSKP